MNRYAFRLALALPLFGLASSSPAGEPVPAPADVPAAPAADRDLTPPDDVDGLLAALPNGNNQAFYESYARLERLINQGGRGSEAVTRHLLGRKAEVIDDAVVARRLDEAAGRDTPARAAGWLLEIAHAREAARRFGRGGIVVGRLLVEGGGLDPELVMAQMPILPGGYFAGEVGDLVRPITFRAHGYENLDVPLRGKGTSEGVADVGTVTLEPLSKDREATLKGTVVLDDHRASGTGVARLSISVGPLNTPHNGYSPRRRWPLPIEVPVSSSGEFIVTGLSPTRYTLSLAARDHIASRASVDLEPGQKIDAGITRLRCADLGFYIKMSASNAPELAWEKDYPAALEKARTSGKPLMVMMTATWCGPCRRLESETLSDPWIRHFLAGFVLVKAYEDKSVEIRYGMNGYPTLVFADSRGEAAHRSVGYQPTLPFAGEIARAYRNLRQDMPTALQALVDGKVIQPPR